MNDSKEKGGARKPEGQENMKASGESNTKSHHPNQKDNWKGTAEIHLPIQRQVPALQLSFSRHFVQKLHVKMSKKARKQFGPLFKPRAQRA
jgi:hypothetical protein